MSSNYEAAASILDGCEGNTLLARRMGQVRPNIIRKLLNMDTSDCIPFTAGTPAPEAFQLDVLREMTNAAIDKHGATCFAYGTTFGEKSFREAIVKHYLSGKWLGDTDPDDIVVTTGSTQGFDLMWKTLVTPGDTVLIEETTFVGTISSLTMGEPHLVGVKSDEHGMNMDDLEAKMREYHPKFVYINPTFGNPTGKTLPADRRKRMAELAAKYNVYVLEDDPYGDVRFYGERLKPIKAYDVGDRVVMLNSFSKIFVPGLRCAFAVVPKDLRAAFVFAKQTTDMHPPVLSQFICEAFLERDLIWPNIERLAGIYKKRWDLMKSCIDKYFPKCVKYVDCEGGYFTWLTFPKGVDTTELFMKCKEEEHVIFIPGAGMFLDMENNKNYVRMSYTACRLEDMEEGVRRMGLFCARNIPEELQKA